jgi:peptide/nickel transport system substrate-binding protein
MKPSNLSLPMPLFQDPRERPSSVQRLRRLLLWICLLSLVSVSVSAQTVGSGESANPGTVDFLVTPHQPGKPGGRLVFSLRAEPRTLNPLAAIDASSKELLSLLHSDLIHIHRPSQKTTAALAKAWTVSADGLRYTLQLRKGLRFSDGHPLTADDVIFTLQALLDERTKAPGRDLLRIQGKFPRFRKLDAHTVELVLPAPYAPAERLFDSLAILPRHKLEDAFRDGKLQQAWSLITTPADIVGTGPFRLKEYLPGQRIVLQRNPHYWKRDKAGNRLPYLEEVVVLFVADQEAEALRFRAGDTHLLSRVSARNFRALQSGAGSQRRVLSDLGPGLEQHFLFFNLNDVQAKGLTSLLAKRAWMQDLRFRRAIAMSIDRVALARIVYQGKATPISHHVSPGNRLWHQPVGNPLARDLDAAQRNLQSLGLVRKGDLLVDPAGNPVEFSIAVNAANTEHRQMATMLQDDLRQLGIRVVVVPLEFRSLIDRIMNSLDYEAAILALRDGDVDPTPQMPMLLSSGGMHFWRPGQTKPATPWEAEIDKLMQAQNSEIDPAKRRELYARVQRIVATQLPFIALVSPHLLVGAHRELGNLQPAVLAPHLIDLLDSVFWKRGDGRQ